MTRHMGGSDELRYRIAGRTLTRVQTLMSAVTAISSRHREAFADA